MNVLGLDLSLAATGMATRDGAMVLSTPASKIGGMDRLISIRGQVLDMVARERVGLVAVEGYSFHSHDAHAHAVGELGGVVRLALYETGTPYVNVPPATLKKYATGKGNASKQQMLVQAVVRFGHEFRDDNEADAMWLCAAGWELLGEPIIVMPKLNVGALSNIVMPASAREPKPLPTVEQIMHRGLGALLDG